MFFLASLKVFSQEVPPQIQANIINGLKNGPAGLQITRIESTPVNGIYQVSVGADQAFYTSEDGQFILTGKMFQVANGKATDVVQIKQSLAHIKKIQQVPSHDTIVYPATTAQKYQLKIFTDVDCPYCAKLHKEIPKLNALGVEVVYLAFPRAGIDSPSFSKIASVWCSENRQKSMDLMYHNNQSTLKNCDNTAVKAQYELAKQLGLQGTPATFFADGKMMNGYHSAESLLEMLQN
ncbi:DsbC family protein [Paraglaciecola aquimarina]|uniref:Thiol:disulfide interchange protein n=1 Tax=Paraglaciecola algarum TaxID=3050085 RepID=A0ABS9DAH0_9ALTE|nr:DsbC family protein [Paraglaciecola sp. G1-23]MCF2949380.1 DsbC family protein [Paraglaciecola sp. G1-23]